MKTIFSILLSCLFVAAHAVSDDSTKYQTYRGSYGFKVRGLMPDEFMYVPLLDTVETPSRPGSLRMRPQDKKIYQWNGVRWESISSSGGSTNGVTNVFRLAGTDSVFQVINGSTVFAFIDSVGAGNSQFLYWNNAASDIRGKQLTITPDAISNNLVFNAVSDGDSLISWLTNSGAIKFPSIADGQANIHGHGSIGNSGSKTTQIHCELRELQNDGTFVATIGTTSTTVPLSTVDAPFNISFPLTTPYIFSTSTPRLELVVYADVTGGGSDPDITLYFGGSDDSHIKFGDNIVSSSTDNDIDSVYVGYGDDVDTIQFFKKGVEVGRYNTKAAKWVNGGIVIYTGIERTYYISPATFRLGTTIGTASDTTITLNPLANADSSRFDVIYLDEGGFFSVIQGAESANPIVPQVDILTQIARTPVLLSPVVPSGVSDSTILFNENIEWTGGGKDVTIDFNDTGSSFNGAKAANVGTLTNNDVIGWRNGTLINRVDNEAISGFIKLKAPLPKGRAFYLSFFNGNTQVTDEQLIPLDPLVTTKYQGLSLSLSSFTWINNLFDSVRFRWSGGGSFTGLYMDYIYLQKGISGGGSGDYVQDVFVRNDTIYQVKGGNELFVAVIIGGGSMVYPDPGIAVSTGSAWGASITDNSSNWNDAFSWGNHSTAGYQMALNGTGIVKSTVGTISYLTDNSTNWNTAYGWGDHSIAGYVPQARTLTINGTTLDLSSNRSFSTPISTLTNATASNTLANTNYSQHWMWNSLAGATGLKLSSNSTTAASNLQTIFEIADSGANATSSQTTYAAKISNIHTGTSSTNVGMLVTVSGANTNTGIIINNGSNSANKGLAFYDSPTQLRGEIKADFAATGAFLLSTANGGGLPIILRSTGSSSSGVVVDATQLLIGTSTSTATPMYVNLSTAVTPTTQSELLLYGQSNTWARVWERSSSAISGSSTLNSVASHIIGTQVINFGNGQNGTLAASLGIKAPSLAFAGTGSVTNSATLFVDGDPTGATNNYGLWNAGTSRFDGNVNIGGTTPTTNTLFEVQSTTKPSIPFPIMNQAARNALSPVAGHTIYCSDCTANDASTGVTQTYNGTTWKSYW